jgi:orotate phosphoribosyltransferase
MNPDEANALLERTGAVLSGHFELTSGRHSDLYVEKARLLERPDVTMTLAHEIAGWYKGEGLEAVIAPAVGAITLGFAVALAAGCRSVFAEREGGRMTLRRGFALLPGWRTLVVEDVVTTGRSAMEVRHLVEHHGAEPVGVAALVDRSTTPLPFVLRAVVRVDATSWERTDCPMCRKGVPLDARGSRHLSDGHGLTVT